jgi:hypothetical protein
MHISYLGLICVSGSGGAASGYALGAIVLCWYNLLGLEETLAVATRSQGIAGESRWGEGADDSRNLHPCNGTLLC